MQEKLTEKSCTAFAEVLASKAPVPGGGGAAALTGALGAALCSMVGNFTVGKKKYAAYENDIQRILEKGQRLRGELLALVDADAAAFAPLARAYAIPQDDPTRAAVLEEAARGACEAPCTMVRLCCEVIDLLEEMLQKGSIMLISDVGCGALLCKAAMESAAMNVFINTKTLKDRVEARRIDAFVDKMVENYAPKAQTIADTVTERIRKRD